MHTVSGSISLPSPGFFSPFPHGTGSLSVTKEYLALEDGPPGFPQGFSCPVVLRKHFGRSVRFRARGCHSLWPAFPGPVSLTSDFVTSASIARPKAALLQHR